MPDGSEKAVEQAHWRGVRGAEGRRFHRSDKTFMSEAGDGRNQGVRHADAVRAIGTCLAHAFNRLPESAAEAHGDEQVALAGGTAKVRRFTGRGRGNGGQSQQNQMVVEKTDEVGCEIATEDDYAFCAMNFLGDCGDALGVQCIPEFLEVADVDFNGLANVRGKVRALGLAGAHGVEGGGLGYGQLVQVVLEFAIAGKTHLQGDAQGGGGIDLQLVRQFPDIEQDIFAGVFQDGPKEFLTLGTEQGKGFG